MRGETDRFRTMLGAIMRYKDPGDCPPPLSRLRWVVVMKIAMMVKSLVARVTRMEGYWTFGAVLRITEDH